MGARDLFPIPFQCYTIYDDTCSFYLTLPPSNIIVYMYIDSQCLVVVVGTNSSLTVLAQVQDFGWVLVCMCYIM